MRKMARPSRRQVSLFPEPTENGGANGVEAKSELVEALADLLLEALGHEIKEGGDDESKDHP
jgi:hypothetical protein